MKRQKIAVLLCVMAIMFSACGQGKENGDVSQNTESVQETEDIADTENVQDEETADGSINQSRADGMDVEIEEETNSYTADDGTEVLLETSSYPVVSSSKNEKAAGVINKDIAALMEAEQKQTEEYVQGAKDEYAWNLEQDFDATVHYQVQASSTVTRNDSGIFSFAVDNYAYTGGAHGYGATTGYNYDAATGLRLSLMDLSENSDSWKSNLLAYIEEKCETEEYKERLFPEYKDYLEDSVFSDNNWYFTESGILISCAPYSIGSYASGSINFEIPYGTLEDYGLKSSYDYPGK